MVIPPFVPNTEDDKHCFQSAISTILKHFLPNKTFSQKEIEEMTDFEEGKWTWPIGGLVSLQSLGFEIAILDSFDYRKFEEKGEEYLKEAFEPEVAEQQIKNSNISKVHSNVTKLLSNNPTIYNKPSISLIKEFINKGYLAVCNVNSAKLNKVEGYVGHFTVVFEIDDKNIYLHDPGLPPKPNRIVPIEDFEDAWADTHDAYLFKYAGEVNSITKPLVHTRYL